MADLYATHVLEGTLAIYSEISISIRKEVLREYDIWISQREQIEGQSINHRYKQSG